MTRNKLSEFFSKQAYCGDLLEQLTRACQGSIAIDAELKIIWISQAYRQLLAMADDFDPIGMPVDELLPHSQMPRVVQTGKPVFVDLMQINQRWCVVNRLPLRDQTGRVIGALGLIFHDDLDSLQPLFDKFARLRRQFEKENLLRVSRYALEDMRGQSQAILQIKRQALRAAQLDTTLLLLGETGTGKELLAQGIHQASPRRNGPFVGINMAALPESLVEAELFGSSAGAYTGADRKGRIGKIQLADGGTLFLDEIAEMPLTMQAKLLRVLQEREVEALGSNQLIKVDVRIIAATAKDLFTLVQQGLFRADLYYRLNVLPIELPPLRQRQGDITLLAQHLLQQIQKQTHLPALALSDEALAWLERYPWPGNIRELHNRLERACVMAEGAEINPKDLGAEDPMPLITTPDRVAAPVIISTAPQIPTKPAPITAQQLQQLLEQFKGNRAATARHLGISRATLYNWLNRLSHEV